MHDPDDTRICMMQIHKNKSAAKLIKLLKITNALWINLSICSTVSVLQEFLKRNLFTFFAKEKKLPADIVFTLILPFRPASYART